MYRYQIPTMSRKHMNEAEYEISHLYLKDWRYTRRSYIVIFSWFVLCLKKVYGTYDPLPLAYATYACI